MAMKITLGEIKRTVKIILKESEVYVDARGYAHDDEGNSWYVGGKNVASDTSFHRNHRVSPMIDPRPDTPISNGLRNDDAMLKALETLASKKPDSSFVTSVLQRWKMNKNLSAKQLEVIVKIMKNSGMNKQAMLFDYSSELRFLLIIGWKHERI